MICVIQFVFLSYPLAYFNSVCRWMLQTMSKSLQEGKHVLDNICILISYLMHVNWLINNYHVIKKQFRSRPRLHNEPDSHYIGRCSKTPLNGKKLCCGNDKKASTSSTWNIMYIHIGKGLWYLEGYIYWFVCELLSQSILPDASLLIIHVSWMTATAIIIKYGTCTGHALHLNSRKSDYNLKFIDI